MSEKFTDYVLHLADDPAALQALRKDPRAAMAAAGLTKAEQVLLTQGTPDMIREAIALDTGAGTTAFTIVIVSVNIVTV